MGQNTIQITASFGRFWYSYSYLSLICKCQTNASHWWLVGSTHISAHWIWCNLRLLLGNWVWKTSEDHMSSAGTTSWWPAAERIDDVAVPSQRPECNRHNDEHFTKSNWHVQWFYITVDVMLLMFGVYNEYACQGHSLLIIMCCMCREVWE